GDQRAHLERPQEHAERHRHRAHAHRAEERRRQLRRVVQQDRHALAGRDAEAGQRRGGAARLVGELGVGPDALRLPDGDRLCAASLEWVVEQEVREVRLGHPAHFTRSGGPAARRYGGTMTRVVAIVSVVVIVGVMGWMWRSGADTSTPAPSVNAKATSVTVEPERPAIATVGAATVSGVVKFRGAAPARERVRMSADPYCQRVAGDSEEVIVNANGTLKNVIVRVLGAPAAAPPPTMVSLAQDK